MLTMKRFGVLLAACSLVFAQSDGEWSAYGHDAGGTKYSPLKQINAANVGRLRVAWTYKTGDSYPGNPGRPSSQQTTPLYIDGVLYATSGFGRVIALDPETGSKLWDFDPKTDVKAGWGDFANRGVATWVDKLAKDGGCARRIYVSPVDARLFALDAKTGKPCADFGNDGMVDLRVGLKIAPEQKADYETTSPPAVPIRSGAHTAPRAILGRRSYTPRDPSRAHSTGSTTRRISRTSRLPRITTQRSTWPPCGIRTNRITTRKT
jgi:quinoprotein glucose dehydrogenase